MKTLNRTLFSVLTLMVLFTTLVSAENPRLIILADMGNEPDEEQQMVHMLTCSNEFELEGLIAVTGKYLRSGPRPDLFLNLVDGYAQVYENLKINADGWPSPEYLRSITVSGQSNYGMDDVGSGKTSPGSELIFKSLDKIDDRPIWVVVNAGSNTLAQALFDYRESHTKQELNRAISRLRVFENGSQDNAGAWICSEFPMIHWIRSNFQTYAYGGPGGNADGEVDQELGPYYWAPYENSARGQNEWQRVNIRENHGALGALYPERYWENWGYGFAEGGGTIPWMGLVNKGLFDIDHPSWGGWGGRFSNNKVADFWSRHADIKPDEEKVAPFYTFREVSDVWTDPKTGIVHDDDHVPVWRWREAMYNDQVCRMDWCIMPYAEANHHPVAAINGNREHTIIRITALPGDTLILDSSDSYDPDGDPFDRSWWCYQEAGSYPGAISINGSDEKIASIRIPTGAGGKQIHIILEIKDQNHIASLFDYRRIVIDVDKLN